MTAKNTKPIDKTKFNAVIKSLKLNSSLEYVAGIHHLKPSTIKNIRRAKTWDEYTRRKEAFAAKVSAKRALNPAPRPTPKPVKAVVKRQAKKAVKVPVRVAKTAPRDAEYMTRAEVNKEIMATAKVLTSVLSKKVERVEKMVTDSQAEDTQRIINEARAQRRPFWKRILGKVGL